MHRMTIVGVALVAMLAVGAAAASTASATKLTLSRNGTALAPGEAIEFTGGYDNFEVTTSRGSLKCEDFEQTGFEVSVITNSKGVDELEMGRLFGERAGPCKSFTGNAFINLASIGGPLKLRANGKATAGQTSLVVEFEHLEYQGVPYHDVECVYAHGMLTGTNTATPVREKLEVQLEAGLKLDGSRGSVNAKHICPKTAGFSLGLPDAFNEEGGRAFIEEQVHTGP
jgi:hypothetical protein